MAKETKAEKQEREALARLPEIVKATMASEAGYTMTDFLVSSPLVALELVEVNEGITNEAGEYATRATQKGIDYVMENTTKSEAPSEVAGKPVFVIEDNVAIPAAKRTGRGGSSYPFDALQVGQSFFIPASEKHPNPAKSLASTISGATARYDEVSTTETVETRTGNTVPKRTHTRKFIIKAVDGGARCWRVALEA
jgi:hypothetical protein